MLVEVEDSDAMPRKVLIIIWHLNGPSQSSQSSALLCFTVASAVQWVVLVARGCGTRNRVGVVSSWLARAGPWHWALRWCPGLVWPWPPPTPSQPHSVPCCRHCGLLSSETCCYGLWSNNYRGKTESREPSLIMHLEWSVICDVFKTQTLDWLQLCSTIRHHLPVNDKLHRVVNTSKVRIWK